MVNKAVTRRPGSWQRAWPFLAISSRQPAFSKRKIDRKGREGRKGTRIRKNGRRRFAQEPVSKGTQAAEGLARWARFSREAPAINSAMTMTHPAITSRQSKLSCSSTSRKERPARMKPGVLLLMRRTTLAMRTPGRGCQVTLSLPWMRTKSNTPEGGIGILWSRYPVPGPGLPCLS